MKRIKAACLLETSRFENEADLEAYIESRKKKNAKFEILSKVTEDDGSVTVESRSQYLNYSTKNYLNS